jgi:threonine dehydrogenase-like Zn-dependent dehydrogenase
MKAVVFHGIGDLRLDDAPEPKIAEPTDAVVRLTSSAICGTDRHFIRGTMPGTKEGRTGSLDPTALVSQHTPVTSAIDAYEQFDRREQGWPKVELEPAA